MRRINLIPAATPSPAPYISPLTSLVLHAPPHPHHPHDRRSPSIAGIFVPPSLNVGVACRAHSQQIAVPSRLLLSGEDQPLLVWRNALLVLNLSFHVVNGIRRFHLQGDRLAGKGLHEDLDPSNRRSYQENVSVKATRYMFTQLLFNLSA